MAKALRWLLVGLFLLLLLPVAQEFVIELVREQGLYANPSEKLGGWLGYVEMIAYIPGFYGVLIFVGGLTLGAWVDTLLRRFDANRRLDKVRDLGQKSLLISNSIKMVIDNFYSNELPPYIFAEIRSLLVDYHKMGIPAPKLDHLSAQGKLDASRPFFSHVGPLLRDGHFKEAKQVAAKLAKKINEDQDYERRAPQGTPA
jgi:hypothetical protein